MTKVVNMSGKPSAREGGVVNKSVVDMLERLLAEAKAGQVQYLAAAWVTETGVPLDAFTGGQNQPDLVTLIGSLELLKHTITAQVAGVGLS